MNAARPLIVVGSGIAGLTVALAAAPRPVCLLSRAADGLDSASVLAQGGIAVAIGPGDSPGAHARDTLLAGAHSNHLPAVRRLVEHAPAALRWLQRQGVSFDQDGQSLHLAREGGHGLARVAHAGGDASGRVLMQALVSRARRTGRISWRHGVDVDRLLLRGDSVAGVGLRHDDGRAEIIESADVVLATGGLGALFSATSNPAGAEGAGLALGLAAGATGRDLEFVQFHPTALAVGTDGQLPLLTEALRGAGAVLRDGQGRALMAGQHPLADLAPRDLVARRVWQALAEGEGAFLHAQHLGDEWPLRFPTVLAACLVHGIDPRRQPMPVTPVAHFHMGGLATDLQGRTSVPGLWAVGEVACNGVHGANRLASNSLLEAVVFGRRIGARLAVAGATLPSRGAYREAERGPGAMPEQRRQLRARLWRDFGPVREAAAMTAALQAIDPGQGGEIGWQEQLAARLLRAGLQRRHSLGAHWRRDSDPGVPARAKLARISRLERSVSANADSRRALAARLLPLLDLTSLGEDDTPARIEALCASARTTHGLPAALCIYPEHVTTARRALLGTAAKVATVVNFPDGGSDRARVERETRRALAAGADEIDLVLPYRALRRGDSALAEAVVRACREVCGTGATLKLILETGELGTPELIQQACAVGFAARVDFLKTSTGKVPVNATPEAAALMLDAIAADGGRCGFKAAGGIRTLADAASYLQLAASRLGEAWIDPAHFRIGASTLFAELTAALDEPE